MKLDILRFAEPVEGAEVKWDTAKLDEIKTKLDESKKAIGAAYDTVINCLNSIKEYNFGPEVKVQIEKAVKLLKDEKETIFDKLGYMVIYIGSLIENLTSSENKFAAELGEWVATFGTVVGSLDKAYKGTAASDFRTATTNIKESAVNISKATREIAKETANIIANTGSIIKTVTGSSIQQFVQKGTSILTSLVSKSGLKNVFGFLTSNK